MLLRICFIAAILGLVLLSLQHGSHVRQTFASALSIVGFSGVKITKPPNIVFILTDDQVSQAW